MVTTLRLEYAGDQAIAGGVVHKTLESLLGVQVADEASDGIVSLPVYAQGRIALFDEVTGAVVCVPLLAYGPLGSEHLLSSEISVGIIADATSHGRAQDLVGDLAQSIAAEPHR
jgi:hypothetical protein